MKTGIKYMMHSPLIIQETVSRLETEINDFNIKIQRKTQLIEQNNADIRLIHKNSRIDPFLYI